MYGSTIILVVLEFSIFGKLEMVRSLINLAGGFVSSIMATLHLRDGEVLSKQSILEETPPLYKDSERDYQSVII